MEWKMEWNGTEISVWNMEDARMEWNGRFQEWNGFRARFRALYLEKNTCRCQIVIIILSQKYSTSISTHIICRQIAVLWLCTLRKQCTYCIIVSKLQFNCSIDITVDDLDRFDLFFFYFEVDNLPSLKFCFLTSSKNSVFAISSPFQRNFIYIFSF